MLYKFKCKAAGDLLMLGPQGDELLRLMGREPAARGILEAADMPAAIAALEAAVAASEQPGAAAARALAELSDQLSAEAPAGDHPAQAAPAVSLRQRAWPMRELLRRAHDAAQPVVWGV